VGIITWQQSKEINLLYIKVFKQNLPLKKLIIKLIKGMVALKREKLVFARLRGIIHSG